METIVVKRDGQKDLRFQGDVLAGASSYIVAGQRQNRWTEITIYKARGGRYVVAVVGRTQWEGEFDHHSAEVCDTAEGVVDFLTDEDGRLSWLAKEALDYAAEKDEAFKAVLYEELGG